MTEANRVAPNPATLQQLIAQSADQADLHANVPALLLELQTKIGALSSIATASTERGRRPFRSPADWPAALGEVAYWAYLLADQTGVDLAQQVAKHSYAVQQRAQQRAAEVGWPFNSA